MPDRNGYIGRTPSDSSVQVARQSFTASGITTDFTFSSGYTPGYFDIYINGVKMIEGSDYASSDGSTFSILNGGASDGDVLEAVAYKAFNAATVTNASDLTVSGNLTVNGSATFAGAGTSVSFATTAFNLNCGKSLLILLQEISRELLQLSLVMLTLVEFFHTRTYKILTRLVLLPQELV